MSTARILARPQALPSNHTTIQRRRRLQYQYLPHHPSARFSPSPGKAFSNAGARLSASIILSRLRIGHAGRHVTAGPPSSAGEASLGTRVTTAHHPAPPLFQRLSEALNALRQVDPPPHRLPLTFAASTLLTDIFHPASIDLATLP